MVDGDPHSPPLVNEVRSECIFHGSYHTKLDLNPNADSFQEQIQALHCLAIKTITGMGIHTSLLATSGHFFLLFKLSGTYLMSVAGKLLVTECAFVLKCVLITSQGQFKVVRASERELQTKAQT